MAAITKRPHQLSDGRDLIYYDADTTLAPDRAPDLREPAPRPPTASMRQDPLTGEWVSIAAARQNRVMLPPAERDPLAPASPGNPSEIPSVYDVAVFENKSPSFGPLTADADAPHDLADLAAVGIERSRTAVGRREVVCFSPATTGSFGTLTASRARTIIEAWADRTAALSAIPDVQQVFPFENRGEAIGVTLHHPHGQIYAYPYITPRMSALLRSLDAYGPALFADILERERASERVLLAGEHWTAFVPFAARWPIEIHVLPHRHIPDLAATADVERDELATLYLRVLRGVDALYDSPTPYIAAWHQAPVAVRREDVRLMLQITSPRRSADKLKFLAGSEAAMGAWVGDIPPEQAAAALRDAMVRADRENPVGPLPAGVSGLVTVAASDSPDREATR
ncbi:RNA polymerase sigma factor SigK [Leifsonia xyli subsp. cynodontis DSM 46306]|jgi:UDPglucose--hexose-1-phosphate uridylyltransferase|uniref:Galactose-1-phosphate uridylyltransferase n=1 Tax=Leifsonia xyli subsp. cynodontis DSM 46306 TaxID=1389489 RepID=U3P5R9_LEIXC|nr:galactose-1-phosphate uridylyltransferase [Leifsonia xyli]AGW40809.1 RNA polymerase sigma factor SigK [Leifsonia xyli subsp. cynodontis DSM 46306]